MPLSIVSSLGDLFAVLIQQIGEVAKDLRTVVPAHAGPRSFFDSSARGLHCFIDVGLIGLRGKCDDLLSRGIDRLKHLAGLGLNKFVIDHQAWLMIVEPLLNGGA